MNTVSKGLFWKLLERFGAQGTRFVLQIILARLLDPEHYGVLTILLIFINLATVFIQYGFSTSLVQNKDVTEEDYSSVFWVSFGIAGILYGIIFVTAPALAEIFDMPDLASPLRILALVLLPGAFNSVQLAKVNRALDFKKVFFSNIGAMVVSGVVSIAMAYAGAGLWALVAQNLLNTIVAWMVMLFTVKWYPRLVINWKRIKVLFSFGWKLMVSVFLDNIYNDLRTLVIGLKYDESTLGYYNRGKQFPYFIINTINTAVQSVMLPAMSAKQESTLQVKKLMRQSILLSSYTIFPMMAGLAAVATPLTQLLLTDKWLPSVPFMQIYCFTMAFHPIHTCNLQAINAMGRSDIFLRLEIIKKAVGLTALMIAVFCFDSPIAIAVTGIVTTLISCFINAYPNKKLIGYSYGEQMLDLLPSLFCSAVMCGIVLLCGLLELPLIVLLCLQVLVGACAYVGLSALFRLTPFQMLLQILLDFWNSRRKR